jgi:predicted Zn-dependent peptidase
VLRETDVDGVPTVVAPVPGPLRAGLAFRVGRADETLSRTGITHLVEHLALFGHSLSDYHHNGATGLVLTHFHMTGSESDVVEYLVGVCDALTDLPLHRLDTEKEILRTEEHNQRSGANRAMPLWRYGSVGYGLVSYPEWGLHEVGADEVQEWARRWFTRENAVLWIAGDDVPAGLRLPLPSGQRMPVPAPSSALPVTPGYFADGANKVVLDAVVRRSTPAMMFTTVLERELYRGLRQRGGYSYVAAASYDSRGDGYATITALADALPEKQSAVVGGFVDVLAKLRLGYVEQADVAAARAQREETFSHPSVDGARLPSYAANILTGQPNQSVEELRAETAAVTEADIHAVAVEALSTALLQVPYRHSADWAGFTAAPLWSAEAVEGTVYLARERSDSWIVVGERGVSTVSPDGTSTVHYDTCTAMLHWPDGARQLIGADGIVVRFEPTLVQADAGAAEYLDARVPAEKVVHLPARAAKEIPQPKPAEPSTSPRVAEARKGRVLETVASILLTLAVMVVVPVALIFTLFAISDGQAFDWVVDVITWIAAVGVVVPWLLLLQRAYRRKRVRQGR